MVIQHMTRSFLRWSVLLWVGAFVLIVGVWQISQLWQAHQQVLTFLGWDGQTYALYEMAVPEGEPHVLRRYTRAWLPPVWSPDGRRFAFDTSTGIRLGYPLSTTHITLSDLPSDRTQPRWSPDGQWLAFNTLVGEERDIMLWPAGSEDPPFRMAVTAQPEGPVFWASDSQRFAYAVSDGGPLMIEMISLPQGNAPYIPELLVELSGVMTSMAWSPVAGSDMLAVASTSSNITLLDVRTGAQETIRHDGGYLSDLMWSPDGRYLLFVDISSDVMSEVYAIEVATLAVRNLSDYPGLDMSAVWSPDGQWIAWVSNRGENAVERNVVLMHAATGVIRELTHDFIATGGLAWWP